MLLVIIDNASVNLNVGYPLRTIFYIATTGSALAGSFFSEKVRRLHFLYFWMVLGIASSFSFAFVYNVALSHLPIIFVLLGISFGLGMPSCFAYLADHTQTENRGFVSSIVLLASNLTAFPLAIFFMTINITILSIILTVWRILGLLLFASLKPRESFPLKINRHVSFSSVFQNRQFVLYFVPWLMFSFVDRFEKIIFGSFIELDFYKSLLTLGPIIASFSIVLAGLLCDKIGRKKVLIYGFVLLGVAYALIGIAPMMIVSWYLYLVLDGIAAGILSLIFLLVIWGDLSQLHMREKYYVFGSIPVFLTEAISLPLAPYIKLIPATSSFSLASFFLFLAVLPLIYASETLPKKKIRLRQLQTYAERAKKVREKYLKKSSIAG
ncbi:MAG: MFS transporter [Candidatus Bathyarchaeia archaeon]